MGSHCPRWNEHDNNDLFYFQCILFRTNPKNIFNNLLYIYNNFSRHNVDIPLVMNFLWIARLKIACIVETTRVLCDNPRYDTRNHCITSISMAAGNTFWIQKLLETTLIVARQVDWVRGYTINIAWSTSFCNLQRKNVLQAKSFPHIPHLKTLRSLRHVSECDSISHNGSHRRRLISADVRATWP